MVSRGVASQPRGKPSGLPFHARFTDVAAAAALREIVAGTSREYGARWTALVMPAGDGSVSVQRLA